MNYLMKLTSGVQHRFSSTEFYNDGKWIYNKD